MRTWVDICAGGIGGKVVASGAGVGYCGILWGKGGFGAGLQVGGGELCLAFNAKFSLTFTTRPHCQVISHSSQPLFLFIPVPEGCAGVAASM